MHRRIRDLLGGKKAEPKSWREAIERRFSEQDSEWKTDVLALQCEPFHPHDMKLVRLVMMIVEEMARPHYEGKQPSDWPLFTERAQRFAHHSLIYLILGSLAPLLANQGESFDFGVVKALCMAQWADPSESFEWNLREAERRVESVRRVLGEIQNEALSGVGERKDLYAQLLSSIGTGAQVYIWTGKPEMLKHLSTLYPTYAVPCLGRWIVLREQRGEPVYGMTGQNDGGSGS